MPWSKKRTGLGPHPGPRRARNGADFSRLCQEFWILIGGANVYPAEVEAALDEHPTVASSCVIGLPDEDYGNRVHAIVQTVGPLAPDELEKFLRERLARYKLPRTYEFVTEPLRGDDGKVRRSAMRAARLTTARSY